MELMRHIDHSLFALINGHGNALLDPFMILLSKKWLWTPVYMLFIWLTYKKYKTRVAMIVALAILLVAVSDVFSSRVIKPAFKRNRPNKVMAVRLPDKKDGNGMYGFVSSHAANTTAVFVLFGLLLSRGYKRWLWFVPVPFLVCYSRIYLGVHYPVDVIGGALVGAVLALIFNRMIHKYILKESAFSEGK